MQDLRQADRAVQEFSAESARDGGLRAWPRMACTLWMARGLVWRLALREITVRYRNTLLGPLWVLLTPLATAAVMTLLASQRVLDVSAAPFAYPAFVLWNVAVWQLFAATVSGATSGLAEARAMVTRVRFTREALVIAAAGPALVDFCVRLLLVAAAFAWYGIAPGPSLLLVPPLLLALLLLALGFGFVLSLANLVTRDVAGLLGIALTFGMLLAPVLYPPPVAMPLSLVNVLNPVSPLLIETQDLVAGEALSRPRHVFAGIGVALLVFLAGWRVFVLAMPRAAERA